MSKLKLTPGPWTFRSASSRKLGDTADAGNQFYMVQTNVHGNGPDATLATVQAGGNTHKFPNSDNPSEYDHTVTLEEAEANARLMSYSKQNLFCIMFTYLQSLVFMPGEWRNTIHGQAMLSNLRDSITLSTGWDAQAIQDGFEQLSLKIKLKEFDLEQAVKMVRELDLDKL